MMVGTILEVMTAEHNAEETQQAQDEREQLANTLEQLKMQLSQIETKLDGRL